jgi:hypothetical protein
MADVRVKDQSDQYHTEGRFDLIRKTKYFRLLPMYRFKVSLYIYIYIFILMNLYFIGNVEQGKITN